MRHTSIFIFILYQYLVELHTCLIPLVARAAAVASAFAGFGPGKPVASTLRDTTGADAGEQLYAVTFIGLFITKK